MENGQVVGPHSPSDLQQFVTQGRIIASTQVTKGSNGPWAPASKVKGLGLSPGSPAPAPVPHPQPAPAPAPYAPPAPTATYLPHVPSGSNLKENVIWRGRPSQIVNLGAFIVCGLTFCLIIPLCVALWKWLSIRCMTYKVTSQRLRVIQGILSRRTDEFDFIASRTPRSFNRCS